MKRPAPPTDDYIRFDQFEDVASVELTSTATRGACHGRIRSIRAGLGRRAESLDHTGLPRRLHVVRRCGGDVAQQQIPRAYSHGQRGPVRQAEIRGRLGGQADGRGNDTFGLPPSPVGRLGRYGWGPLSMPAVPSGGTKDRRSSARRRRS